MPHQTVIDGFEFAEFGKALRGAWRIADFTRRPEVLHDTSGALDYAVSGERDKQGRPALRIELRGVLRLTCQRCLEPMDFPLAVDTLLTLARHQSEVDADALESDLERVLGSKSMAVRDLLEEELVLAVPVAPRHADCAAGGVAGNEGGSPFAKLRGLLGDASPDGRKH